MNRPPKPPEALRAALERLKTAGVASPRADAELLLARRLGVERHGLYAGVEPDPETLEGFAADIERRARREPLQLILGETEFYGIRLEVRPGVFIPRPETEVLVGLALENLPEDAELAYDLGCGCGNIACALAVNRVNLRVTATDLSAEAVELTRENAALCGVGGRVEVIQTDLGAGLAERADLLCCNPPYVPAGEIGGLEPEVRDHDPLPALDGGEDGLAVIRRLAGAVKSLIKPGGLALVEIGDGQGGAARRIFGKIAGARVEIRNDLAGRQRVAVVHLAPT